MHSMVFILVFWLKPAPKASPAISGMGFFEVACEYKDTYEATRIEENLDFTISPNL